MAKRKGNGTDAHSTLMRLARREVTLERELKAAKRDVTRIQGELKLARKELRAVTRDIARRGMGEEQTPPLRLFGEK